MERPLSQPLGTPVEDLDTPALVIDVPLLERNIVSMREHFADGGTQLQINLSAHLCPAIGHLQTEAANAGGFLVGTLSEAEVFAQHGFKEITVVNPVVSPLNVSRACNLARRALVTANVDNAGNIRDLSTAAVALGVQLRVLVALRSGACRPGVAPGQPAVELAREVATSPGLVFAGISGYGQPSPIHRWLQSVVDTRELIERQGLPVQAVAAGGSMTVDAAVATSGITHVPAGAYALSDVRHQILFEPAVRLLSRVVSRPEPGLGLLDLGHKAVGADSGLPLVIGCEGARIARMNAEHGYLTIDPASEATIDLETRVWTVPHNSGHCMNVRDYVCVARARRLEAIWPVLARGRYR